MRDKFGQKGSAVTLTDSDFILEAEKRYTFDAEFHARVSTAVGIACTAIKSRTGVPVDDSTQKDMHLVAALALTSADLDLSTGDWTAPPPQHGEFRRLSIPGGYCIHCGTQIHNNLKCAGCGRVDPQTKLEKP